MPQLTFLWQSSSWALSSLAYKYFYWKAPETGVIFTYTPSDSFAHSYDETHDRSSAVRPIAMAHVRSSDHLVFRIRTILSHYQTILTFIVQQLHLDTRYVLCICNYFGNSLRTISNFFCCTKILSSLVCSNANCGRGFKYLIRLANIKIELRNTASWWRRTSSF